jgi:hypothetical protein
LQEEADKMAQAQQRRWYDRDPLLSMAMKTLEESKDTEQLHLAMHVIKIINEHKIDSVTETSSGEGAERSDMKAYKGRWYDFDRRLQTSIEALRCCNAETQKLIARDIAQMIQEEGERW